MIATQTPSQVPDAPSLEALFEWWADDPCFFTLTSLTFAYGLSNEVVKSAVIDSVTLHTEQCHSCYANVRRTAATSPDAMRAFAYDQAHQDFSRAWIRQGGNCESREVEGGRFFRYEFAPDLQLPFRAMEVFLPSDKREKGRLTFEVTDQRLYEDPRDLVQRLDESATNDAQTYGSETGSLHWRSIFSDEDGDVFVRFQGMTKRISGGWTLHSRYSELVRARMGWNSLRWESQGRPPKQSNLGLEALMLEGFAVRYLAKKSWFCGFLDVGLRFRALDEKERLGFEPAWRGDSLESQSQKAELLRAAATLPTQETNLIETQDRPAVFAAFVSQLDPLERRILELKLQGVSDEAVGTELGLRRETVNRKYNRMKEKLTRLWG